MRIDLEKFLNIAGLLAAPLCVAPLMGCPADDTSDDTGQMTMTMTSATSPGTDATMTGGETMDTTGVDTEDGTGSTGVDTEDGTGAGSTSEGADTGSTSEGGGGSTSEGGDSGSTTGGA